MKTTAAKTSTLEDHTRRLRRVLVHVRDHLDEPLDPERLAAVASFSRYHFSRMFRGMLGETVGGYVRRLRLERAAQQLVSEGREVLPVALEAGYEAAESFTRAFRAHFGHAPSQWRRQARPLPPSPSGLHHGSDPQSFVPLPLFPEKSMKVEIQFRAAQTVACVRHVGPYLELAPAFHAIAQYAGAKGLFGPHSKVVGIYWDDPREVPPEQLRADAGVTVLPDFQPDPEAGITVQTLEAGDTAIATHVGPYEKLHDSYSWLMGQWLPQSGRCPADRPCYEMYIDDPTTTPPEKLRTLIHLPLLPVEESAGEGAA